MTNEPKKRYIDVPPIPTEKWAKNMVCAQTKPGVATKNKCESMASQKTNVAKKTLKRTSRQNPFHCNSL
jgi:hypothetical protein